MYQVEMLVLIQSLIASVFICGPLLLMGRYLFRSVAPRHWSVKNWSDTTIRTVAFMLFMAMLGTVAYFLLEKNDYYALISPILFVLSFFFVPLYKKMN